MTAFLLLTFVTTPCLSQSAASAISEAEMRKCSDRLTRPVVKGFLTGTHPQLALIDRHADAVLNEMAAELNSVQRFFFLKGIRRIRGQGMSGGGKYKLRSIYINVFNIEHPMGRVSTVHEAQHFVDNGPGWGLLGDLVSGLNPNYMERTEQNAFRREYGLLRRLISDPEFDLSAALAAASRPPETEEEIPYDLDEPIFDEWYEPSQEFLQNPGKFLGNRAAYQRLRKYFLEKADGEFTGRIEMARRMSQDEYVRNRLIDYEKKIARDRKLTYALWVAVGGATTSVSVPLALIYCQLMGWLP